MNRLDTIFTFFVGLFSAMYWTSFTLIMIYTFLIVLNTFAVWVNIDIIILLISFLKISWFGLFSLTKLGFIILFFYALPAFLFQLTLIAIISKHEEGNEDDPFAEFMQAIGKFLGIIGTLLGGFLLSGMF